MKPKYNPLDVNLVKTTLVAFMESYNKSILVGFPHASIKVLKQFQESTRSFLRALTSGPLISTAKR